MRLFLLSRGKGFQKKDIVSRSRTSSEVVGRELKLLSSINFIKKRNLEWSFNSNFQYADELESLLVRTNSLSKQTILDHLKKAGRVKLVVASGIFIKNNDSRVDLLIVGDKMSRGKIESGIRRLEAEMGVELIYAIFDTEEFVYRVSMYDKLVRDILDYPHEILLQVRELSTQALKKS